MTEVVSVVVSPATSIQVVNVDGSVAERARAEQVEREALWRSMVPMVEGGRSLTVSAETLTLLVAMAGIFAATLPGGSTTLKIKGAHAYGPEAVRSLIWLTQPATGAPGTLNLSAPGNNAQGEAQTLSMIGTLPLSTANGATNVLELITQNSVAWYLKVLG
jgi:hypothetical protein